MADDPDPDNDTTTTLPVSAAPPFDNRDADLIIRTSDRVDFHVFKLILREASPVLSDILSLPEGSDVAPGTVDVTESSVVWDHILRICHPGTASPAMIAPDHLWPLLEAAKKYEMTAVRETVATEMLTNRMLDQEPLRVYALACGYGIEHVAVAAARASLRQKYEEIPYVPELRCTTSAAYHRLIHYRRDCVRAAMSFAEDPRLFFRDGWKDQIKDWLLRREYVDEEHYIGCVSGTRFMLDTWTWSNRSFRDVLGDYMARSTEIIKIFPHGGALLDPVFLATTVHSTSKCIACRNRTQPVDIVEFTRFHASEIDAAIAKVQLVVES
ncbi:hypothetical protein EVJ58_g8849 [Rhodofomes roseus]|uniref:BTB domain-containing protein n=1 Tax=Rhodofomes roseus TaxID=34475 RepID=A0A4Y9Y0S9_9APHY|nr:hypothetical protein EVJ58_g8849 [Rhodofomes roseus]